jgi:hypothetical protein
LTNPNLAAVFHQSTEIRFSVYYTLHMQGGVGPYVLSRYPFGKVTIRLSINHQRQNQATWKEKDFDYISIDHLQYFS